MVLISGDCTSEGGTSEYELYKSCIEASDFDADRIYMARGNHDSQRNDNFIRFTAHKDMVRPTEDSPWFYVLKEGKNGAKDNLFICLAQELDSISNTPNQDNLIGWKRRLTGLPGPMSTYLLPSTHSITTGDRETDTTVFMCSQCI